MRLVFLAILLTLVAEIAYAQDAPSPAANTSDQAKPSDEATEEASDAPKPQPVAASEEAGEIKVPPGFKIKKRGDKMLYCTKGSTIGTRFVTETCYDEQRMRDYLLAREQGQIDFERGRSVCATSLVCTFH